MHAAQTRRRYRHPNRSRRRRTSQKDAAARRRSRPAVAGGASAGLTTDESDMLRTKKPGRLTKKEQYQVSTARATEYAAEQCQVFSGDVRDEVQVTLTPGQGLQVYNGDMVERSDGIFTHKTFKGAFRRAVAGEEARMPTRYVPAGFPAEVPYHITLYHEKHFETMKAAKKKAVRWGLYTGITDLLKETDISVTALERGHRLLFRSDDDLLACTANMRLSFSASVKRAVTGSFTLPMLYMHDDATSDGFVISVKPHTRRITVAAGRRAVVRPALLYMASLGPDATVDMTKTFALITSERGFFKFTGPCTIDILTPSVPNKLKQMEVVVANQRASG